MESLTLRAVQSMIAAATSERRRDSPERLLMASILEDAVRVYCRYRHRSRAPRAYFDAKRWMEVIDERWPFSFEGVCEALDLDPGRVRRTLQVAAKPPLVRLRRRPRLRAGT